ncbi:uncharacterized protein METZ01_LOCUS445173, partial [marine metagenome]
DNQGYESNSATGSIIINYIDDTPVASSIELNVDEDQELLITLVGSDVDTDDSNLSFNITQEPNYGQVAPIQRLTDQYNYIPNSNFYGLDTLKYNVSDGTSESEEAEVTIIVNSINDLPTATIDNNILELDENSSVSGTIIIDDIDGDLIHLEILQEPSNGQITTFDSVSGSFTYEPNDYFSGNDNFSVYAVEDDDSDAKSEVLNITFITNDVNYNPIAFNQTISMFEDEMLSFNMSGQDIDGDILSFNLIEFPDSFEG